MILFRQRQSAQTVEDAGTEEDNEASIVGTEEISEANDAEVCERRIHDEFVNDNYLGWE